MTYIKLSEQLQHLTNPQRSDTFVKQFREAVRIGTFDAIRLPERFTLAKQFKRHGMEGKYQRDTQEMLFELTPAFQAWFEDTNRKLTPARAGGRIKQPTVEAIEAGVFDFKALAAETRRKMEASHAKGQALGHSRLGTRKGSKRK